MKKRLKVFESRRKLFQHISKDIEELKNRTRLIQVITNYISPYVERKKNAKIKMLKNQRKKKFKIKSTTCEKSKKFFQK